MTQAEEPGAETLARMTVTEVVTTWPNAAALFAELEMICPGCAVAAFCDLTYAAGVHGVPLPELLAVLEELVALEHTQDQPT